jgi:hypothetical protein
MKIARFSALAALALALISGSSQAAFVPLPTSLATLLPAGTTTSAGAIGLSNFSYAPSGTVPVAASSIMLSATGPAGFTINAPFGASSPNSGDSTIGFTASSGLGITSVTLTGNPAVTGAGVASITETFYSAPGGTVLGQILVSPTTLSATFTFASALSSVYIVKDILYSALAANSTAQISVVTQTFTTGVPEPASVVMMGLGLVGAIGVVRLRRTTAVA